MKLNFVTAFAFSLLAAGASAQAIDPSVSFHEAQRLSLAKAFADKGLPAEGIQIWADGGFYDDFFQAIGALAIKTAAAIGKAENFDGHWRLAISIPQPGRNISIACVGWVQFKPGTYELHKVETRYCATALSDAVAAQFRTGTPVFGTHPDLAVSRDCSDLAPGMRVEGEKSENCRIVKVHALQDPIAQKYEVILN